MACIHNQAKIDELKKEIQELENDIIDLNTNLEEFRKEWSDFVSFSSLIKCVEDNMENGNNHVTSGVRYDNGDLTSIYKWAIDNIGLCLDGMKNCRTKIQEIESEITNLETQIGELKGDCELCVPQKKDGYVV